jgi:hypothetical protein
MNAQSIIAKHKQARAAAHMRYYYSMRDSDAAEMLEESLSFIDWQEAHELRQFQTRYAAIESRRRELRAA